MSTSAHRAADPARSAWVSANAGSGKTRVLVDRIARLLLAGAPPERLLCLTFTKAAASEMASRLAARLGAWALMSDGDLAEALTKLGHPLEGASLASARRLFARALETPGGLKIQTIHAFCERLLGRFPEEAGVPVEFAVADDRSAGELLRAAQDDVLTEVTQGRDAEAARSLARLASMSDENGFEEILRATLSKRDVLRRMQNAETGAAKWTIAKESRFAVARAAGVGPNDTEDMVKREFIARLDEPALRQAARALTEGTVKDRERGRVLAEFLARPPTTRADHIEDYTCAFLTNDDKPRASVITNGLARKHPAVEETLRAEQQRVVALVEHLRAVRCVEMTLAILLLAGRVFARYEDAKRRRALLDYDDLIERAALLLGRAGAAEWVLYKLDGGLDHILIDEAQDTSPAQWNLVARLAEEFFVGAGARPGLRTIFAVGDEKQSIFSFQGADPTEFEKMRAMFAQKAKDADLAWDDCPLIDSYRSVEPVLALVDRVFSDEARANALAPGARKVRHTVKRIGQAGLVELWSTEKPDPKEKPDPWTVPVDFVSPSSPVARLARRVCALIERLIGGERLLSQDRPIRAGDILVLVQRRGDFVEELIRLLKQRGVPVAGADRLFLLNHIAVMDLMALADFALMPEDDLTLATVLRSPLGGLGDAALLDLTQQPGTRLWDKLRDSAHAEVRAFLEIALARAALVTPYAFFADLLSERGARKKLVRRLGPDANDPIDEFLRLALDYERLNPPSLQGFLSWLRRDTGEIKRDMDPGQNEVRVMTVHGAKGLEAPVVILPDTCAVPYQAYRAGFVDVPGDEDRLVPLWSRGAKHDPPPLTRASGLALARAEAEHLRLLYVALTRARDRLYVCGYETSRGRPDMGWHKLVEDAMKDWAEKVSDDVWRLQSAQEREPDGGHIVEASRETPLLPAWALAPPAREAARPTLSPSALSGPGAMEPPVRAPGRDDQTARFRRGRLIHRLLETLPALTADRREAAARRFLESSVYGVSAAEQDDILASALRVLNDPAFAPVFAPGSRAEAAVIGRIGHERIYGIVDRLAVTATEVLIVDYKTNRPPAQRAEDVPLLYLRQMAAYRAVLQDIYPGRQVAAALLWTETPLLMTLPDATMDGALATLTSGGRSLD